MATLLFLGASVSQLPAIRHARRCGHRVVAVDGDRDAVAFQSVDVCINLNFTDVDIVVAAVRKLGVEGVLAVSSDRAVPRHADNAGLLTMPAPDCRRRPP